ncbi:chemotaxis protein CheB [Hymenobacter oligotrophus]|uniref:chemotaxis protein CheB n=1 Tax=Hymenobacter oligotrophus TaxID=2319843 RepID=UPI0013C3514A|nr:CheB methylesterase domain-containing protein [Hymenobacter oligotrophus]
MSKVLRTDKDVRIVASTSGAHDLLDQTRALRPDLIIVGDQSAPVLHELASCHRGPVLLYSAQNLRASLLRDTAKWGVYDHFGPMPAASHPDHAFARRELLRKVHRSRRVVTAYVGRSSAKAELVTEVAALRRTNLAPPRGLIVLGGSTGGAAAVEHIVRQLAPTIRHAVVVAVHLPASFTAVLVERLRKVSVLPVVQGAAGMRLEPGKIVVVPGGRHWTIRGSLPQQIWLAPATEQAPALDEPSIDLLLSSAARAAGRNTLGVVLTGLGNDGSVGAQVVRQLGGTVVAQDEQSSAVFGMPKAVIRAGHATVVLSLGELPPFINAHTQVLRPWPLVSRTTSVSRSYTR